MIAMPVARLPRRRVCSYDMRAGLRQAACAPCGRAAWLHHLLV